jgi:predicted site-specific integrase-resolvase
LPEIVDPNRYYKPSEVAAIFGVTAYTVRSWLNTGKLAGGRIPSGHWRVSGTALINFAREEWGSADQ